MEHLLNREVTIHLGTVPGFTESIKGKILEQSDKWIRIEAKATIETVATSAIKRISVKK